MPIITLTTDFGTRDGYAGAVKGVISRLAPDATVVDIAHDVPPGDIGHAAWVLKTSTLEFPSGTIHVVVVDPGVGGARRGVIARAASARGPQMFIGPDNGVFAYLEIEKAWSIDMTSLPAVSPTFHGRDVFAPVAASVARMHTMHYGEPTELRVALEWGTRTPFKGRVVHIDRYGNLITDLPAAEASGTVAYESTRSATLRAFPLVKTYESVRSGELLAYIGSAGTVEIAVRDGRADDTLDAQRGDIVTGKPPSNESQGPYR